MVVGVLATPVNSATSTTSEPWPGVRASWPHTLEVTSTSSVDAGARNQWHFLDNIADVQATGLPPVGTLFCVHGNPTWSYLWRSLLSAATSPETLAAGGPWRVVAVDQLDMGFSDRTGKFRRLEDRVNDLGDFTDALGLEGPVVSVGHDWGGIISSGWATRHRDQLSGMILTNTAVNPAGFSLPPALKLALHPAVHVWGTKTTTAFLDVTHGLAQPSLDQDVKKAFMAPYKSVARRAGVGNFVADIPASHDHPSWPTLDQVSREISELEVPVLMLWGPKDPVFSDRYLQDLMMRLPQADVHRFEGASHLVQEDRDVATPAFNWLAQNVLHQNVAVSVQEHAPYSPMLAELDSRKQDASVAVVDMARPGISEQRSVTWAQLARDVDDLAVGLSDFGVSSGDRVSLLVPPGITLTTLIYACLRLGAVIVVADAGLGNKGMSRAIKGAGPKYLIGIERALVGGRVFNWPGIKISADDFTPASDGVKRKALGVAATVPQLMANGRVMRISGGAPSFVPADPDAEAAVLFTSGSTGPAKGVVYTHRRLAAMRDALKNTYNIAAGSGLVAGFAPFALLGPALGATSVTPDMDVTSPATLRATALADAAAAIDATIVFASPAALVNVVATSAQLTAAQRKALADVELLLSAGAPLALPLLEKVAQLLPHASLHTPYGMTEALPVTDIDLEQIKAAGTGNGVCVGFAVSGATVAIAPIKSDGGVASEPSFEPLVTGEILIKAPHVKERYDRLWITQELSASIPGWHRSGDIGHFDESGRLWVEGRLAHILTTASGVRTPVAAEQLAESVAGVHRAAVVGVGPAGTQAAVVIVELEPVQGTKRGSVRSGLATTELSALVRAAVAPAGIEASAVLVISSMPTDIRHNSKIDRAALAAWAANTLSGGKVSKP